MDNEILNQEENDLGISTIMLTDEEGNEILFEFLDLIEYEEASYVILSPLKEDDEDEEDHVVILRFEEETEDGGETYTTVEDDEVVTAVYNIFKEKWQDQYSFIE